MSSFCIFSIARIMRSTPAGSPLSASSSSMRGLICHDNPNLSLSQPHCEAAPPPAINLSQ